MEVVDFFLNTKQKKLPVISFGGVVFRVPLGSQTPSGASATLPTSRTSKIRERSSTPSTALLIHSTGTRTTIPVTTAPPRRPTRAATAGRGQSPSRSGSSTRGRAAVAAATATTSATAAGSTLTPRGTRPIYPPEGRQPRGAPGWSGPTRNRLRTSSRSSSSTDRLPTTRPSRRTSSRCRRRLRRRRHLRRPTGRSWRSRPTTCRPPPLPRACLPPPLVSSIGSSRRATGLSRSLRPGVPRPPRAGRTTTDIITSNTMTSTSGLRTPRVCASNRLRQA